MSITSKKSWSNTLGIEQAPCTTGKCSTVWITAPLVCLMSAYTKFILFHRRVSHKVQGRLLPSRTIMQGVDMGRSFSVYLFCLAMDLLFTYLNRIPGVLSVQGYIDDTTIAGDAQCLEWLTTVSECKFLPSDCWICGGSAFLF